MKHTTLIPVALLLFTAGAALVGAQRAAAPASQTPVDRPARQAAATFTRTSQVGGRLAPSEQAYAAIDGTHLMQHVNDMTAISRRYRDHGHTQFWGRIIGTDADAENAQWMLDKFKQLGLADVHQQVFDLPPQWMPKSWSVTASGGGKTLDVATAQPTYQAVATPADGLDVEAVYVGLGSDAELNMAKDLRGKAVLFYSIDLASRHVGVADNAIRRIEERGAAAILVAQGLPGNMKTQFYPVNSKVPTVSLGQQDGFKLRDLISAAGSTPARMKIRLDVDMTPNLKSSTVWGSLPGTTDETIFVIAHRDGWFEGANDNAAGVATMVGLAEYFAKIPQSQRRRTINFLGTTGHHNSGAQSGTWLSQHPEVFAKTALLLNAEHTGAVLTSHTSARNGNSSGIATWFAGSPRLSEIVIKALDAFEVPTYPQSAPTPAGEIGRYFQFAPAMQVMTSGFVWHSDEEKAETISSAGLAAITRTYAKVMTDVNAVDLKDLRTSAMSTSR
ncbi:MAG TPA: M28 family peptidase [Vicinamibacterales bacterium]